MVLLPFSFEGRRSLSGRRLASLILSTPNPDTTPDPGPRPSMGISIDAFEWTCPRSQAKRARSKRRATSCPNPVAAGWLYHLVPINARFGWRMGEQMHRIDSEAGHQFPVSRPPLNPGMGQAGISPTIMNSSRRSGCRERSTNSSTFLGPRTAPH